MQDILVLRKLHSRLLVSSSTRDSMLMYVTQYSFASAYE
jgi:hypothetical protein